MAMFWETAKQVEERGYKNGFKDGKLKGHGEGIEYAIKCIKEWAPDDIKRLKEDQEYLEKQKAEFEEYKATAILEWLRKSGFQIVINSPDQNK